MRTWRTLVALLLALALVGAACGDDDDEDEGAQPTATTAAQEEEQGGVPVHTIGVSEEESRYSFTVPEGIEGGAVKFELDNSGKKVHDFQLASVDGQHSDQELIDLISREDVPIPEWIHGEGGVGTTAPGKKLGATLQLEEGEYVYFCSQSDEDEENDEDEGDATTTTPTGATNATSTTLLQPDVSKSHIAKGMLGRFTVSGSSGATVPQADASIRATEYTFSTPASLDAGTGTLELKNAGTQLHHLILFPIVEGKTIDDVKAAFASEEEPTGPPPVDFEKAVDLEVLDPDRSEVQEVDLAPGDYAMVCFLPDRGTSGPPHVAKGMLVPLKVE